MEKLEIIRSIATRSDGDIYLGVVGAVRTGKSTFIKKVIETVLKEEGVIQDLEIYVTLTNNEKIHQTNKETRTNNTPDIFIKICEYLDNTPKCFTVEANNAIKIIITPPWFKERKYKC